MLNRKIKPEPFMSIKFDPPDILIKTFPNGIKLLFSRKDNLPIIYSGALINSGSKFDPDRKEGLAYLLGMLIDEGAGDFSSLELDDRIEFLGSSLNINVDSENIALSMISITENFRETFDILSQIIQNPRLERDDFERQKKNVLTKILQVKDDPSLLCRSAFQDIIFKGTAYSHSSIGKSKSLKSIEVDEVGKFYNKRFRPDETTIVIVGDISYDEAVDLCSEKFSDWTYTTGEDDKTLVSDVIHSRSKKYLISKSDAPQSEILIGHTLSGRTSENFYSRTLMNTILGGQFTSRLNSNLRESKGYTYGIYSSVNYNKNFGIFSVSTSVQSEVTEDSVRQIMLELQKLKEKITDEELEFAKSYLIKRLPSFFESGGQIMKSLFNIAVHDLPLDYYRFYENNIKNVSCEQVIEAANSNIKDDMMCTVIVGNPSSFEDNIIKNFIRIDKDSIL